MDVKIFASIIDEKSTSQINTLASQPAFSDCKIRIMPDVHAGAGCVIGFTADMGDKVIPNIVGVDIGCGMLVAPLALKASLIDFDAVDNAIRENVPSGFAVHQKPVMLYESARGMFCYNNLENQQRFDLSIGTLGGGNHFIEIDKDDDDYAYLVIHTGSRNLGKQVCDYYQGLAETKCGEKAIKDRIQRRVDELKSAGRQSEIEAEIAAIKDAHKEECVPKELSFLTGRESAMYLYDMRVCQEYASLNRYVILRSILEAANLHLLDKPFETIHNYINFRDNIIRKGAVSAAAGEKLIIPMNMRDGSLICIGKGNDEWNCSAPHGAGRIMSRSEAKRTITMSEYTESMNGIYSTSVDNNTIDEAPMAYKPMESITECIGPTVEIVKTIKPVYNFKASDDGGR